MSIAKIIAFSKIAEERKSPTHRETLNNSLLPKNEIPRKKWQKTKLEQGSQSVFGVLYIISRVRSEIQSNEGSLENIE